jgi:hypothetical protein
VRNYPSAPLLVKKVPHALFVVCAGKPMFCPMSGAWVNNELKTDFTTAKLIPMKITFSRG